MALRLRRGTQAERDDAGFIPDSGEPVWTIDTKRLYIGDGTTPGGNLIQASGGGGGSITGITDTTTGSVLALSDLAATFSVDVEMDANADITLSATSQLNGTGQISLTGNITGNDFSGNAATFASVTATGGIDGDLTGSVFADDSTLLIDAVNGKLAAPATVVEAEQEAIVTVASAASASPVLKLQGYGGSDINNPTVPVDNARLGVQYAFWDGAAYTDSSLISGYHKTSGAGYLALTSKNSSGNFFLNAVEIDGDNGKVIVAAETAVEIENFSFAGGILDTTDSSAITVAVATEFSSDVTVENNLVVNNALVCDTLEVTNFVTAGAGTPELTSDTAILLTAGTRVEVTSSPFKLASFTDTERDALTAENGDMIYNTDNNRPEMYVNGAWKIVDTSPIV
jgi:hypothetical protein